jgi:hypothetical protein
MVDDDLAATPGDRRAFGLWALCLAGLFAFFYQGGGWNQNARFDTVRALVERGSFEISEYAANTGDKVNYRGKLFATRPPGQALLGAPVYFGLFHLERAMGFSPGDPNVATANAYALTWFTSGLPALALVVLMAFAFQRRGATRREALLLASAFGTGSLVLPYSGALMSHNLTAFLLFAAWFVIATRPLDVAGAALAGALLGFAVLCEFLAAPAAVLLAGYGLWRRPIGIQTAAFALGPLICLGLLLWQNQSCFGDPFTTVYTAGAGFKNEGLWLGVFDWPQPMRLYWLTLHPFRGLFYCCPVFIISVFALIGRPRWRDVRSSDLVAGAIVASFLLFNLSFNGWTGGWGVGPRYLIPAMPFLFLAALSGSRRLPRSSALLVIASTLFMLCVSAVMLTVPGPNEGDAPDLNPLWNTARVLASGNVSINDQSILERSRTSGVSADDRWDSWNVGEILGLKGWLSLLPACGLVLALYHFAASGWPGDKRSQARPRQGLASS